ncbi:hypothetical protein Y032_0014g2272 [Ancylostoma ceylanicum]|uniref:Uncharacterized protein n=1 Tax=Ancylostoma ceylanicum TaxID=53326 RepID=A0A016VBC8_9BILA|nr:hypothetical protein Y032_0014g2272 [Ancylostoma ceylanicum]
MSHDCATASAYKAPLAGASANAAPPKGCTMSLNSSWMTIPSSSCEDLLGETEFPFLCSKPSGGEGKRTKGKRCDSLVAHGAPPAFIVKQIDDPAKVLGKRRKARVLHACSDTYAPGLMYSMDKKNRWSQVDAATLLNGVNNDEVSGQVVELRTFGPACHWRDSKVTALHEIGDDGEVTSKTAKGSGASLSTISTPPREKQRGTRARRDIAARRAAEEEERNGCPIEEEPEKAKLRYTLIHDPPMYYGRPMKRISLNFRLSTSGLTQYFRSSLVTIRCAACQNSFGGRTDLCKICVCYIHIANITTCYREREEGDLPKSELKPFELVDISPVLHSPATFEFAHVYTDNWSDFNFLDQVESLQDKYAVRWLDLNYQRVLVDATPALTSDKDYEGAPIVMLVIERCRNKKWHYLRVLLNSTIPSPEDFDWKLFKAHLRNNHVCDIPSLVEATVRLPLRWRKSEKLLPEDMTKLNLRREHLPAFNVAAFSQPARRITVERMAILLRAECEHLEADTFEKVEQDDFDSELENDSESSQFADLPSIPAGVKCGSCAAFNSNDLYELDDCWMCRTCLKQMAVNQIRLKSLPICLPVSFQGIFKALQDVYFPEWGLSRF